VEGEGRERRGCEGKGGKNPQTKYTGTRYMLYIIIQHISIIEYRYIKLHRPPSWIWGKGKESEVERKGRGGEGRGKGG